MKSLVGAGARVNPTFRLTKLFVLVKSRGGNLPVGGEALLYVFNWTIFHQFYALFCTLPSPFLLSPQFIHARETRNANKQIIYGAVRIPKVSRMPANVGAVPF